MEAIIFIGIQASGKSTFFKERFADSHMRLNLDMLKTRHREKILLQAMLEAKQPFVVDNTNPAISDREPTIAAAKAARFRVVGYYFQSSAKQAIERNAGREGHAVVPERAILGTYNRLELPTWDEGFDELYYVSCGDGSFEVQEWSDEV